MGNCPFITEAVYFGPLTALALIAIILFNGAFYIGLQNALDILKKLYTKSKLLLLLLAVMFSICLAWNADVISGYVVQPYFKSELAQITWNDWDKMSSGDKLRIGQSYYWEYKGREYGLYDGSNHYATIMIP